MVKKLLASKKGASSVLVILLLLALVVFGVAALTTSLSGLRLGQKISGWSSAYYAAEGLAARCWAQIDAAASRAAGQSASGFEQALAAELAELDFETQLDCGDGCTISYEAWEGDIGLYVRLVLDTEGSPTWRPVQWYQIK
jgi:Tfp pilus assembly protein PilX